MFRVGKKFSKPNLSRVINGDVKIENNNEREQKIRADLLLVKKFPEYKRATLQKFIKLGFVKADDIVITKANTLLKEDTELTLDLPEFKNNTERPPVVFENENVLVLNKPAGMLSMKKGEFSEEVTLEDFGLLAHRLDRETSGVVILAKNIEARAMLQKQFQDRKVKKNYLAVVCGHLKHPKARIELPIARNLKRPTTFEISPSGREAITEYEVIKNNNKLSLVHLNLLTGRTHQIRVHLKHLGVPILGDIVYGGKEAKRLYLHAEKLEITVPFGDLMNSKGENKRMTFEVPAPEEFKNVF